MSIEKQSLEAHVELCAERYDNLEDRLEDIVRRIERSYVRFDKMEQSIDKVQDFVTNHHTDRFQALESRQGSLEDKISSTMKIMYGTLVTLLVAVIGSLFHMIN